MASTHPAHGAASPSSSTLVVPQQVVDSLLSADANLQAQAVRSIRSLMAAAENVESLSQDAVTKLVQIISEVDPTSESRRKTRLDAAWILTKLTASSSELTAQIVADGAIEHFVAHVADEGFEEMRLQSVWVLGNIAGDNPTRRDLVIQGGLLPPLLHLISQNTRFKRQENSVQVLKLHAVRMAVWCLSNLCRVSPGPPPHYASLLPSLPVLARILQAQDREILRDGCFAFASLAVGSHEKIQSVINSGVIPRLVILLQHNSKMVVASALRAVGNILLGDDSQTQVVIDHGGLPALLLLLLHDYEPVRRDACRAISNITAGNADQIQAVLDAGIFPILISLMYTPNSVGVDVEAGWALLNVARRGRPDQIDALKTLGCDERVFTLGVPLIPRGHHQQQRLQQHLRLNLHRQGQHQPPLHLQPLQQQQPPLPPPLPQQEQPQQPPAPQEEQDEDQEQQLPQQQQQQPQHQQQPQQQQQPPAVPPNSARFSPRGSDQSVLRLRPFPPLFSLDGAASASGSLSTVPGIASVPSASHFGAILMTERRRLSISTLGASAESSAAPSNVASNANSTYTLPLSTSESAGSNSDVMAILMAEWEAEEDDEVGNESNASVTAEEDGAEGMEVDEEEVEEEIEGEEDGGDDDDEHDLAN